MMHEEHQIFAVLGVLKKQTNDLQNARGAYCNDPDDLQVKIKPYFLGYTWLNVRKKTLQSNKTAPVNVSYEQLNRSEGVINGNKAIDYSLTQCLITANGF